MGRPGGSELGWLLPGWVSTVWLCLWSQAQRPSSWQRCTFFFFALDNFYLPAPEGLLMTPTKPHTWGPCVPVNEGTIKGSVVELGCGGKCGAGVAQKAKSKDSCLAAAAEPQCCNYGSPRTREPVPGNQGGRRWEKPRTTTRKWPPPFAATKTQCNQK